MTARAHRTSRARPWASHPAAGIVLACAASLLAGPARGQETLALQCDDDRLGASTAITFLDSSPEFHVEESVRECDAVPGSWSSVVYADETDDSTVQAAADVSSDAAHVLEIRTEATLEVDDGTFDFASVAVGATAEAVFDSPDAGEDVSADVVLDIQREGEFEDDESRLTVEGPSVDLDENLEDLPDGETRFAVELEPDEEYVMLVTTGGLLTDDDSASTTIRVRVETVPVPEPAAAWLTLTGGAVLCAARCRFHAEKKLQGRRGA